jgi:hypothetical protein
VEDHLHAKVKRLRKELVRSRGRTKPTPASQATSACRDTGNNKPHQSPPRKLPGLAVYKHEQVRS